MAVAALLVFTLALFAYTVWLRRPWMGELSSVGHQWLTASTLKFAGNWYEEGPLQLGFALLENPRSIEFTTFAERQPYMSYPPGAILPIYLASVLRGRPPTLTLIMSYDLLNHLLIALVLAATVLLLLTRVLEMPLLPATCLAASAPAIELLTPGPLYWHQNVYYADQAALLPFAVAILLEVALWTARSARARSSLAVAQQVVLFAGCATDWFFYSICAVLSLSRVAFRRLDPEGPRAASLWIGPALAASLFVVQLVAIGGEGWLWQRYLYRSGFGPDEYRVAARFWELYVASWLPAAYGVAGPVVLAASVAALVGVAIRSGRSARSQVHLWIVRYAVVAGLPCVLHTMLLPQHAADHSFSTLKWSPFLATVPFVLLPALFLSRNAVRRSWFAVAVAWLGAGLYLLSAHPGYAALFPDPDPGFRELGDFLRANARHEHVVFSPDVVIPPNPPQALALSRKRVYLVATTAELEERLATLPRGATPLLLVARDGKEGWWRSLPAEPVAGSPHWQLLRIAAPSGSARVGPDPERGVGAPKAGPRPAR